MRSSLSSTTCRSHCQDVSLDEQARPSRLSAPHKSRSQSSMTSLGVPGGWIPLVRQESGISNGFMQAAQSTSEGASMCNSKHSPVVKQKTRWAEVQALHKSQNSFVSPSHSESPHTDTTKSTTATMA